MTLKLARRTHTKQLLGTRLPLSYEYSYIYKIMLTSKYFCKNEYLNKDMLYIKQTILTQIRKNIHISAVETKTVLKKSYLTVVQRVQHQNSIVFPPVVCPLTVCHVHYVRQCVSSEKLDFVLWSLGAIREGCFRRLKDKHIRSCGNLTHWWYLHTLDTQKINLEGWVVNQWAFNFNTWSLYNYKLFLAKKKSIYFTFSIWTF